MSETTDPSPPNVSPPAPEWGADPFGIAAAAQELQTAWCRNGEYLQRRLLLLGSATAELAGHSTLRLMGLPSPDPTPAVPQDARFQDSAWQENPWLDIVKESYLLGSRWWMDTVAGTPSMESSRRHRAVFWSRQAIDAAAPTNTLWGNPAALKRSFESAGANLQRGAANWTQDLLRGDLPMQPPNAFTLGSELAPSRGQVVYRNRLIELIQYAPLTDEVHATPILFVPPWINKFYILDLNPRLSLVDWLLRQGYTVFMISWRNPGAEMAQTTFDDYLRDGVDAAVAAVRTITGREQLHAVGYCLGGTLLACYLAWRARRTPAGTPSPIAHWSAFTTLVDFEEPGEIGAFINESTLALIDSLMATRGYLDGRLMAFAFRLLRPNSLIWSYATTRYLMGDEPPAFDVLYWNTDNTRMPAAMHRFYLREFYQHNRLREANALTLAGETIDLGRIEQPLYCVATEQDHIAPWQSVFRLPGSISAPTRTVLATSGHILGILSPPVDPPKRRYWVADTDGGIDDPERWRSETTKTPGSWWHDWDQWLGQRCGPRQAPPPMGHADYPPLVAAPGTYVLER